MLNVRRLCVVVNSLISAAKVCDCVSSAWCWQAQLRYVVEWLSCCTKIFLACSTLRDSRVRRNDTGLKLHLVRLLNKCSICVINLKFKFGLLGMLLGTINLLPGVRWRLSIDFWMIFYCFKLLSSRMNWFFFFFFFKNSGIFTFLSLFLKLCLSQPS